jgi:hypothetical protein
MRESAVGIARVSSKDQEDGYSLASQDKLISTYSDNHDFRLLKVFKIAETASKAKQRRIFREAMKFVADPRSQKSHSRKGRSPCSKLLRRSRD